MLHRLESFFSEAISFYSLMEGGGEEGGFLKKKGGGEVLNFVAQKENPFLKWMLWGKERCVLLRFSEAEAEATETHNDNLYPFQDHRNNNSPIGQHFTFPLLYLKRKTLLNFEGERGYSYNGRPIIWRH